MAMAMVEMLKAVPAKGLRPATNMWMSPDEDAEEADEEGGGDHEAVGEDAAVGEVGDDHGGEAHAGEDGDVDLRVAEEPEEMEPEERGAVAAVLEEDAVDEVLRGEEEGRVEVAVAEEEEESGEEDAEGEDAEQGGGEPSPDGERETLPGHAVAAEFDDGGEGVDGGDGGGDGEEGDGWRASNPCRSPGRGRRGAWRRAEGRLSSRRWGAPPGTKKSRR